MVNNAEQMLLLVGYEHAVNLVFLHHGLYSGDFRRRKHNLRRFCHYVADLMVEELLLPTLCGASEVTVGDESYDTSFFIK